uniref:Putative ovule protein n=1 Tax=Solanum chacoense TaxID=4108 RepID=A0A0V0GN08_SOLCH
MIYSFCWRNESLLGALLYQVLLESSSFLLVYLFSLSCCNDVLELIDIYSNDLMGRCLGFLMALTRAYLFLTCI